VPHGAGEASRIRAGATPAKPAAGQRAPAFEAMLARIGLEREMVVQPSLYSDDGPAARCGF
jgi:hypothetical protein